MQIIERKKLQVNERKALIDIVSLQDMITRQQKSVTYSFSSAIKNKINKKDIAIIAELKKASPSKGIICQNYLPQEIAKEYEQHGATCLSVLTETDFFLGNDNDIFLAKKNCNLPVLRKDFIIDPYQIYESKWIDADCILLIVSALSEHELNEFYQLANEIGLDVLVEVNDEHELKLALNTKATLIGINNRNLKNFTVDLDRTITLAKQIPSDRIVICESGIQTRKHIEHMQQHNINTFLIGETLMKCDSPGEKLSELLGG